MTEPVTFDAATAVSAQGDGTYQVDLLSQYAVGGSKPYWGGAASAPLPPLADCVTAKDRYRRGRKKSSRTRTACLARPYYPG
jgi:hypothetical protein